MSIERAVALVVLVVVLAVMVRYFGWFFMLVMGGLAWVYEWAMETGNEPVFSIVGVGLFAGLVTWMVLEARWGVPGFDAVAAAVDAWISARLEAGVDWIKGRIR